MGNTNGFLPIISQSSSMTDFYAPTINNSGSNDEFIAKLNTNGYWQYVSRFGTVRADAPINFVINKNNIYQPSIRYQMILPTSSRVQPV